MSRSATIAWSLLDEMPIGVRRAAALVDAMRTMAESSQITAGTTDRLLHQIRGQFVTPAGKAELSALCQTVNSTTNDVCSARDRMIFALLKEVRK